MADLSNVLKETVETDKEQFKERINQNSLFPNAYNSDLLFSPGYEDEDDDDEFEDEDEDLFDEEEFLEEEGYEEDFDFDEDEEVDEDEKDLEKYN